MEHKIYCDNCSSSSELLRTAGNEYLLVEQNDDDDTKWINVDIRKAASYIFATKINYEIPKHIYLCKSCRMTLSHLYSSKKKFTGLTHSKSKIQNIIGKLRAGKDSKHSNSSENIENLPDYCTDEEISEDSQTNNSSDESVAEFKSTYSKIDYQELQLCLQIDKLPEIQFLHEMTKLNLSHIENSRGLQCKNCKRKFLTVQLLENHHNSVHTLFQNTLSCPQCPKKFLLKWFQHHHYNICKTQEKILHSCQICKQKFNQKDNLEMHKLKVHDIRKFPFICNNCSESYQTIVELRSHLFENHMGTPESHAAAINIKSLETRTENCKYCSVCQKQFKGVSFLRRHMKIRHGITDMACRICKRMFGTLKDRTEHYQSAHKKCNDCGEKFARIYKLKRHLRNVHKRKEFSFQCEVCGITFITREKLRNHYRYHIEIAGPPNYCSICNRSFKLKGSLTLHMQFAHSKSGRKQFKCKHKNCNASFVHKYLLGNHLKDIHKVKLKFQCKICEKAFMYEDSLRAHGRVHKAEEKFRITAEIKKVKETSSGKVETTSCFSSKSLLFTCPICGKSSEYKTHFLRHVRSHKVNFYTDMSLQNKLPLVIKCKNSECQNLYSRMDNMLKHMKYCGKQSTLKSTTCNICKVEVNNFQVEQHFQRHHFQIMQNDSMKDLNEFYDEDAKVFQCKFCQKSVSEQKYFIEHVISKHKSKVVTDSRKVNNKLKNIQCPTCFKILKSKKQLYKHKYQVHATFDKRVDCKLCGRTYKTKASLKDHIKRVHKNLKN